MLLLRVTKVLAVQKIPYAVVGGYAVALHGVVRGTVDLDIVINISEKDYVSTEQALHSLGLQSRLPVNAKEVFKFREEYIRNRSLIAWSFYNPHKPSEIVDIIVTENLKKIKTATVKYHNQPIRIAAIDDLIRMKERSGRPQDLEDAAALRVVKE